MSEFHVTDSSGFREELERQFRQAASDITILSGYIKADAMEWLSDLVPQSFGGKLTVVARWAPQDLLSGSSDLAAFSVAKSRGWSFHIHRSLHAKCIMVDDRWVSVGSANITRKGLGINLSPNVELIASGPLTPPVSSSIRSIVKSSIPVDTEMVSELEAILREAPPRDSAWDTVSILLMSAIDRLYSRVPSLTRFDLFETTPSSLNASSEGERTHDAGLLGIAPPSLDTLTMVKNRLPETRVWRWLIDFLNTRPTKTASFGEITRALHDEVSLGGKIRRSEVKRLLANTMEWIEASGPGELSLTKRNVSVLISLNDARKTDSA